MKTDVEIKEDVIRELRWDPEVPQAEAIGVALEDGVATLTGHASTYGEKLAAEKAAARVYGVKAVANQMEVRLAGARKDDTDIARAISHVIEWNTNIPADQVKARVDEGWVTLDGAVDYGFQRKEVERMVRHVRAWWVSPTTSGSGRRSARPRSRRRSPTRCGATRSSTRAASRWSSRTTPPGSTAMSTPSTRSWQLASRRPPRRVWPGWRAISRSCPEPERAASTQARSCCHRVLAELETTAHTSHQRTTRSSAPGVQVVGSDGWDPRSTSAAATSGSRSGARHRRIRVILTNASKLTATAAPGGRR